jgi:RHS repeat-associated protein
MTPPTAVQTLTLNNGVNMSYTYDNDSRVTGITYKFNANTLGNLTYAYDSLGRRIQVGGSFAQTGLPGSITSATYDVANELTNWNGTSISYDNNGNMLSDGSNVFTWNARNQVATLNSVSLQYDGFGRRTKNLQNTSFLFDGANAVQELSGSTIIANLLNGGIDEIFIRADSNGSFTPLKDALGSTIALVNASGNLVTQYAYDPFGNTTVSGASSSNAFQYTGRENEANGLYFYRNRYYSPLLGRFINQDPMGFAGSGTNFYAYAFNNPISFSDPSGLTPAVAPGVVAWLEELGYTQAEIDEAIAYLEAGGAEGVGICASTVVCGLIVLDVGLAINDGIDVYHLGQAYGWWGQPKPTGKPNGAPSLAGRYAGGKPSGDDDDDCKKEWKKAGDFCSQLDDLRTNDPIEFRKWKNIFGPNILSCMKGQVSERCGGHKI